jgi:hypothetical protein
MTLESNPRIVELLVTLLGIVPVEGCTTCSQDCLTNVKDTNEFTYDDAPPFVLDVTSPLRFLEMIHPMRSLLSLIRWIIIVFPKYQDRTWRKAGTFWRVCTCQDARRYPTRGFQEGRMPSFSSGGTIRSCWHCFEGPPDPTTGLRQITKVCRGSRIREDQLA